MQDGLSCRSVDCCEVIPLAFTNQILGIYEFMGAGPVSLFVSPFV